MSGNRGFRGLAVIAAVVALTATAQAEDRVRYASVGDETRLTIGTCIGLGYGFTRTIVVVFAAQAAIQVGYFFGLLAQTLYQSRRTRMVL